MIFAFWFFVWLAVAESLPQLVLPAFALAIRFSYVERRLPSFPAGALAVWLLLAGFTALTNEGGVGVASLLLGKVLLSTICIAHFVQRIQRSRLKANRTVGQVYFFLTRALVIVRDRLRDIGYWRGIRVRASSKPWLQASLELLAPSGIAALIEMLSVRRRIISVVNSRGGYPETVAWIHQTAGPRDWAYTAFGDAVIMVAMFQTVMSQSAYLIPPAILNLFQLG